MSLAQIHIEKYDKYPPKNKIYIYMTKFYVAHTHTHTPSSHYSMQRHHLTLVSHSHPAGGLNTNASGFQMRSTKTSCWPHQKQNTGRSESGARMLERWTHSWRWQMQDAGWRWGSAPHHCCLHSGWADHRPASPGSDIFR